MFGFRKLRYSSDKNRSINMRGEIYKKKKMNDNGTDEFVIDGVERIIFDFFFYSFLNH